MGVLHGRDVFSTKWITAIIIDSSRRAFFVPIKHNLGDFFLTELDNKTYCFKIDATRQITYRETMVKAFRFLIYDTKHYVPLAPEVKELELMLKDNNLPKVNMLMAGILKILGRQEKSPFEDHNLNELIQMVSKKEEEYGDQARNLKTYLENLGTREIVTPVRGISDFIEGDLVATNPDFLGTITAHFQRTDVEHKKVTNTPIGAKHAWMKFVLIFMGVALVGAIIYFLYDSGAFDDLESFIPSFEGVSFSPPTIGQSQDVMSQFSPQELRAKVDAGEISMGSLPPDVQQLVRNVEAPKVDP